MPYQDLASSIYSKLQGNDLADILLFSGFLYYFLKYLTARPQRPIMFLSLSIGLSYIFAKFFKLVLVRTLLESLVTVLLIVIAIVFQRDIRRFIEHVSSKISNIKEKKASVNENISKISDIVFSLAKKRIGSILVFTGHSPITNVITGGKKLSTDIDNDVIESIFDSRTPAHDGAMLIEGGKITHIACQLPLSKGTQKPLNLGTRHSAILGVSERSDSLSIVTSEEKGTISIAQNGLLLYDIGVEELKKKLTAFFNEKSQDIRPQIRWLNIFSKNILLKLGSLCIATALWAAKVHDPGVSQANLVFPVVVRNIKPGFKIDKISSGEITIRLSGPSNTLNAVRHSSRKLVLNFRHVKGTRKRFHESEYLFEVPDNIKIHDYSPSSIEVSTSPKQEK